MDALGAIFPTGTVRGIEGLRTTVVVRGKTCMLGFRGLAIILAMQAAEGRISSVG